MRRRALPERSTRFLHETLVEQWSQEIQRSLPANPTFNIYSSFCFKNDLETVESVILIVHEMMASFKRRYGDDPDKGCILQVSFIHTGGKASKKAPSETAFYWREAMFHTYIQLGWDGKWLEREMRDFAQQLKELLQPFSLDKRAVFFNFPDGALKPDYHEQAYWGNNHKKLQEVKQIWDKDNYFDSVQGVRLPHPSRVPAAPSIKAEDLTDQAASWGWDHHAKLPSYPERYSNYLSSLLAIKTLWGSSGE